MNISIKLQQLREENNLSQNELATRMNISRQSVSKWETGVNYPDIENITLLAEIFNVSIDELLTGDPNLAKKVVLDSKTKKWHILVIIFLLAILVYIGYFLLIHHIFMVGFLIATLFMLVIELKVFFTGNLLDIF